jgi:hypothetical protein
LDSTEYIDGDDRSTNPESGQPRCNTCFGHFHFLFKDLEIPHYKFLKFRKKHLKRRDNLEEKKHLNSTLQQTEQQRKAMQRHGTETIQLKTTS